MTTATTRIMDAIEANFGEHVQITYLTVNQGVSPEDQESGLMQGRFNGDSSNAGRTLRYEFDTDGGRRHYLFVDEIRSVERTPAPVKPKTRYQFPSTQAFTLTEDQRAMVIHCLRIAAERFGEDAGKCMVGPPMPKLADQLKQQAVEAREIAERIENAEYVKLGREVTE